MRGLVRLWAVAAALTLGIGSTPARAEDGYDLWLRYHRLHGSPRMYYSSYDDSYLAALAATMAAGAQAQAQVWCIFDNTASGAATGDALRLRALLG